MTAEQSDHQAADDAAALSSAPEPADEDHAVPTRDLAPTAEPDSEQITSLIDLFCAEHGQDLPRRFLRYLVDHGKDAFDARDVEDALLIIDDADPDLRRLRFLIRAASRRHKGRFREPALQLARRAVSSDLDGSRFNEHTSAVADRFASTADLLAPRLREAESRRRALSVLLVSIDVLAGGAGLSPEDALPVLRRVLPDPDDTDRPRNPRLDRMAQLSDPNMTLDRLRGLLDFSEPWERSVSLAQADRSRALSELETSARALADEEATSRRLREEAASLQQELAAKCQEIARLNDQLRDAGALGKSDVSAVRARSLAFLQGRLRPLLETAREAGNLDPPRAAVMKRMVGDAMDDVDGEIQWLTSSD